MSEERLQKVLARAGIAARRKAEELITAGRVRVDGEVVTTLGTKVDPRKQRVELDGRPVMAEKLCYGILHKPRGMVTTLHDPEGRPTALDILRQVGVRVMPVGRLDFNTSGALLFTNDGDFAQGLSHARGNVPKVYAAKIQRRLEVDDLAAWAEQIEIDGKVTRPADVRILRRDGDKTWLEVTLKEGKNRQVRRLGDHAGTPVVRLSRLSHAGIDTTGLRPGEWRFLTTDELKSLRELYGVPQKIRGAVTHGASVPTGKGLGRGGALPRAPRRGGTVQKEGTASRDGRPRGLTAVSSSRAAAPPRTPERSPRPGSPRPNSRRPSSPRPSSPLPSSSLASSSLASSSRPGVRESGFPREEAPIGGERTRTGGERTRKGTPSSSARRAEGAGPKNAKGAPPRLEPKRAARVDTPHGDAGRPGSARREGSHSERARGGAPRGREMVASAGTGGGKKGGGFKKNGTTPQRASGVSRSGRGSGSSRQSKK